MINMLERIETQEEIEHKATVEKTELVNEVVVETPTATDDDSSGSPPSMPRLSTDAPSSGPAQRSGRWTPDEKILFLYGLKRFGKGRWKKMSIYLPHRSLVQIKSHAQKVLKRLEAGENVFRRLEENYNVIDSLIVQAAKQRDALVNSPSPKTMSTVAKRKRVTKKAPTAQHEVPQTCSDCNEEIYAVSYAPENPTTDAGTAVIAAAALCQLSSLGVGWDQSHQGGPSLQESC